MNFNIAVDTRKNCSNLIEFDAKDLINRVKMKSACSDNQNETISSIPRIDNLIERGNELSEMEIKFRNRKRWIQYKID